MDAIEFIYTGYTIELPKWTYSFLTPQFNGIIQLISSLLHVRNVNPSSIMSQNTKNTQKVTAFNTTDNQVCHW
jgi:radical SAM superfamily enzyme with C-terminal helix-hairpin-helix motif